MVAPALTVQMDLSENNPRIQQQLDWYVRHPEYLDRTIKRASRYLYYITSQIEQRDMPGELALLPVVESAFDPFAYSHGRASGLWQFIPSTGRIYGLDQNWWYDGRRDVLQSTNAALSYLQALSDRFDGKWKLALASYNSGAGTVMRAVSRNESRSRPTDFWHLDLPRETRAYVPKLLAIAMIVANPDKYGVKLASLPDAPYFQVVDTGSQIDLAQAAKLADVDLDEIYLLNPGYNRWATNPDGPHRLLVPLENADTFRDGPGRPAQEPAGYLEKLPHCVRRHPERMSHRFHTTTDVLRQVNHLHSNMIRRGQQLLIPVASRDSSAYALSAGPAPALAAGQLQAAMAKTRIDYKVTPGDTLWDIARAHHVNVKSLARWNGMAPKDPLMPGKKLAIWSTDTRLAMADTTGRQEMVRKIGYRVRRGDSLYRIAGRFNISVNDIVDWNEINPHNYLRPGESLVLYVDIRNSP